MDLKTLKEAKHTLKHQRKDRIRGVIRSGPISNFGSSEHFIIQAINELWDLVCDVANRKIDEAIKKEATKIIDDAQKALEGL